MCRLNCKQVWVCLKISFLTGFIMRLLISGSSFLLPKNKAWNVLAEKHNVQFADYGNWSGSILQADPGEALALVLFLDDLIDLRYKKDTDFQITIKNFTKLLEERLDQSHATTIVCFASGDEYDVIRCAKTPSQKESAQNAFLDQISSLNKRHHQLYLIDLDKLFNSMGYWQAYDQRNWYAVHCRLSSQGLSVLADGLRDILQRASAPAYKVLVLDCDNTLWGGVIGEDGIEGLVLGQDGLGQAYVDFQLTIKYLARQGVIVVLASKNNEEEVWRVFDNHPAMVLKRSDIVSWKINWIEKFENVQALAEELNLSLDTFVFWDDSPVERKKMSMALPQVFTVNAHSDVFEWPKQLSSLTQFAKFSISQDDKKKTQQYQNRAKFVRERKETLDEAGYLRTIQLEPEIHPITPATVSRAEQLCAKTNQFNLRTVRHTAADLQLLAQDHIDFCFLTSLSDIYGDHGIVGLVCIREIDKDTIFIDTFLQSCRVLGRYLESWMLQHAVNIGRRYGYTTLVGEFIPTDRNKVAADFFELHNFLPFDNVRWLNNTHSELVKIQEKSALAGSKLFYNFLSDIKVPFMDVYDKS